MKGTRKLFTWRRCFRAFHLFCRHHLLEPPAALPLSSSHLPTSEPLEALFSKYQFRVTVSRSEGWGVRLRKLSVSSVRPGKSLALSPCWTQGAYGQKMVSEFGADKIQETVLSKNLGGPEINIRAHEASVDVGPARLWRLGAWWD